MAEFQEVAKQKRRMCEMYANNGCHGCPVCYGDCGVLNVRYADANDVLRFENAVMSWATEHPEPVYPTWLEYLARYCGAPCKIDFSPIQFAEEVHGVLPETYIHWLMTHRIPAGTAEKLGIEPKEGV